MNKSLDEAVDLTLVHLVPASCSQLSLSRRTIMHFPLPLLFVGTLVTVAAGFPLSTRSVATKDREALLSVLNRISTGIVRVDAEVSKLYLTISASPTSI